MEPWGRRPTLGSMSIVAFTIMAVAALVFVLMIWAGQHQS
jgi:hypothetical protein